MAILFVHELCVIWTHLFFIENL